MWRCHKSSVACPLRSTSNFCPRTKPTLQGKAVFSICRQQVDTPYQYSSGKNLLLSLYGFATPVLPLRLLSQVCHTTCSSFAYFHGSYLCSTTHFMHSFLRYASLRYIHYPFFAYAAWYFILSQFPYTKIHIQHRKPFKFISLHYATLRHTCISVGCSPPAAHNFCVPCCLLGLRVCHAFCNPFTFLCFKQKITPNTCVIRCYQMPVGLPLLAP